MARKRTPTKEVNGQRHQTKQSASKHEEKPSPRKSEVRQLSVPGLRWSHLTLVTLTVALVTASVCYSMSPELTSFTTVKRKVMPSLRKIVQSEEIPYTYKSDDLMKRVIQERTRISSMFDTSGHGRIVNKFMQFYEQRSQDDEKAKSWHIDEYRDRYLHEMETGDSSKPALPEILHEEKTFQEVHLLNIKQKIKESDLDKGNLETISTEINRSEVDETIVETKAADERLHLVDSADSKNSKTTEVSTPKLSSLEEKVDGGSAPPRTVQSSKTGRIILSAENSHVSLNVDDLQRESSTREEFGHTDEMPHNSKEIKNERKDTTASGVNLKEKKSEKLPKTKKISKAKVNPKHANPSKVASPKDHPKEPKKKQSKTSSKREDSQQDPTSEERLNDLGESKSSHDSEFKPSYQRTFTPKKTFYDGRRIAPVELLNQKPSDSSVKVFLFDDFLSQQECEGLMRVHNSHVEAHTKPPILCFDSINTLRKHIRDAGKQIKVTSKIFTAGTLCVNSSFSLQLQTWLNSNWSYSTAFYPDESKFSTNVAARMERSMGLKPENGGKFQITSYPLGKAYKTHTDCTPGGLDERDRVVSVLMYLNDAEDGGETKFPDLGIWVKPKRGRAIVWNNMSPSGECEPHSRHAASLVKQGKKYILIRWYYYKSFQGLGQRPSPPELPLRDDEQAKVSCDDYDNGSCRWYDEWTYEHLLEYRHSKLNLT